MMLTQEERVRSFAHRNLKQLDSYYHSTEFDEEIPPVIGSELVGVYVNSDTNRIFFLIDGLYIELTDQFIKYANITTSTTNYDEVGKQNTNTIIISTENENIPVQIFGGKISKTKDIEFETQDVWSVYTFIRHVAGK